MGFPGESVVMNPRVSEDDLGLIHGWEDPLEKVMAAHSSVLAWEMPWTKEPGGLQSTGSWRVWHAEHTST